MRKIAILLTILLSAAGTVYAGNWREDINVNGDLRYRLEMIKQEDSQTRNRHRIRARAGLGAKINNFTKVNIQFATGSDDPVSTNQTLDNGSSSKNLMLDLAYFTIKPPFAEGLNVIGGKFKNPFFRPGHSELIWDSDWNPEGGVLNYRSELDNVSVTVVGAGLWIEERSASKDTWIGAGQAVLGMDFNEKKSGLKFGAGFYNYFNSRGFAPFYDSGKPMGNSVDISGNYMNDFELLELFLEIDHDSGLFPVTFMGDFVTNTAAESLNNGWMIALKIGKGKDPGSWDFRYIYREVEKDAVAGTFTDSDFRGGGTDGSGHEFGGGYRVAHNMKFEATYFINSLGLEEIDKTDFDRFQLDMQLEF